MRMDKRDCVHPKYLSLIDIENDERVVYVIKKHPIGLFAIYLTGFAISFAVFVGGLLFSIWYQRQTDLPGSNVASILTVVSLVICLVALFITYVAGFIYGNNIIIVTTDKIIQVLYRNLIDRKISQLSLGDLQDVTVDQKGLFARIFNYGTLVIETAGEQNNYNFTYTPSPYNCAKEIVDVREESIELHGN